MAENGSKVVNDIQGGFGTVLAEGRLYVVVFATMVMTATVFVVWNGIQQDGPWLDRLLTGLEHMSWAIITSTGLTTTLILVWERLAMVLARRWLDRKREEVLQEGRQEGLHKGLEEGRQEGRLRKGRRGDEKLRCSSRHGWRLKVDWRKRPTPFKGGWTAKRKRWTQGESSTNLCRLAMASLTASLPRHFVPFAQ